MISLTRTAPFRVVVNRRRSIRFRTEAAAVGYADWCYTGGARQVAVYRGRQLVAFRRRRAA